MAAAASVTISRTALGLPALSISGDGTGTYFLTKKGLGRPVRSARYEWLPAADNIDGAELYAVALENSALPLEVVVQAASTLALNSALEALDDALWQSEYVVTVTVDGQAKQWNAFPTVANPSSGLVEPAHASEFFEVVAFTVPILPTPA